MKRELTFGILVIVLAAFIAGCASKRPEWDRLYSELSEDPYRLDNEILSGRRIVIDPGHGGYFEGATGIDSLTEADVNLGVALYLWGLLNEAGAEVYLTRTIDTDFLPDSSIALEDDLEERMRIANRFDPEVFLSLHHNSNISLDRDKNLIEVYYKGSDTDASLELATDIHRHLARNLGIEESFIRPGNYYVLRNSLAGASVLGEASYISHPGIEDRLRISSKQRLEAEAYFLGLVSYFSRGIPVIESIPAGPDTITGPGAVSFVVSPGNGVPVEPSSLRIISGDEEVPSVWDLRTGTLSHVMPPDAPNALYAYRAYARSARGGSALSRPVELLLSRPARYVLPLSPERSLDSNYSLTVKLLDALGGKVADGEPVKVSHPATGKTLMGVTRDGIFRFTATRDEISSGFILETRGLCDTLSFSIADEGGTAALLVSGSTAGKRIEDPYAVASDGTVFTQRRNGLLSVPAGLAGRITVYARGYRPAILEKLPGAGEECVYLELAPVLGGAFHGKRIAIDPAGGGVDDYGRGPMRTRGATVNLKIAKYLRDILSSAGAEVALTHEGEETLSLDERIFKANISGADLDLGLHFGSSEAAEDDEVVFYHYPGSENGRRAAMSIMELTGTLPPFRNPTLAGSAGPFLQQTKAPSCEVHAAMTSKTEPFYSSDAWMKMVVEGIVAGLARYYLPESMICIDHDIVIVESGRPVAGASISIDGIFSSVTSREGKARFRFLDPGGHMVSITLPGSEEVIFRRLEISYPSCERSILDIADGAGKGGGLDD